MPYYRFPVLLYLLHSLSLFAFATIPWDEPLEGPRVIQDWLLAAVPNTGAANTVGIQQDHIEPLLGIRECDLATVENGPSLGDALTGDPDFNWRLAHTEGILDIDEVIQPDVNNEMATAYLCTYITVPADRETVMFVGSDDSIRVWLNGEEVHHKAILRVAAFDQDQFNIRLLQGKNVLVMKVSQQTDQWAVTARLQHSNGLLFSTDKTIDGDILPAAPRYVRNWLILPLPNPAPGDAAQACDEDLIWQHDGKRSEENVARRGVVDGERTGDWTWQHGSLLDLQGDNVNQMVNLSLGWVGDHNHVTLYAFCSIYCPDNRYTNLRIGSDDAVVVWLGGQEVWRFDGLRGLTIDEDSAPVVLRRGMNYLLVKICEEGGGWGMSVRFEDDGGLQFSTNRDFQTVFPVNALATTWAAIRYAQ